MNIALLFPGQGSQYVGMGRSIRETFPDVRQFFETANDTLEMDIERACLEGPEAILSQTLYTQPAVFTASVAILWALQRTLRLTPAFVAGHSLGEYAALIAAGAISFEDGIHIVRKRAEWMHEAVPPGTGGMAALMGLSREVVEAICSESAEDEILVPANYNSPAQIVVSGHMGALERAVALGRDRGGRVIVLPVSAPFHTPLMEPVSRKLEALLKNIPMEDPVPPLVSNVTAAPACSKEEIRRLLVQQVCSPVLWEDSIRYMLQEGVRLFIEVGPGTVLKGLMKRIDQKAVCYSVEDTKSLEHLKDQLAA